jgi:hypothetical protein
MPASNSQTIPVARKARNPYGKTRGILCPGCGLFQRPMVTNNHHENPILACSRCNKPYRLPYPYFPFYILDALEEL